MIGAMARKRRPKPFDATKEAKRRARRTIGAPPPVQLHGSRKGKKPKHRKQDWEQETDSL
jgi:hypothetical protein